jgi:pyruvate/oxaloacetate carboxyltransferase
MKRICIPTDMLVDIQILNGNGINSWKAFYVVECNDTQALEKAINCKMLHEAFTKYMIDYTLSSHGYVDQWSLSNVTLTSFDVDWKEGRRDQYTFTTSFDGVYTFTTVK